VAIECRYTPTQHVKIRHTLLDFREMLRFWNRIKFDFNANFGKHRNRGLTNFLIIVIAIVRAIELDFKPITITRISH